MAVLDQGWLSRQRYMLTAKKKKKKIKNNEFDIQDPNDGKRKN